MKKQSKNGSPFGSRIFALRKEQGWSQPELGKKIGTSGDIIGRYERGAMNPSIEVASKLAAAFEVTVDSLINDQRIPSLFKDRKMVERWESIEELPDNDRETILYVVDSLVRDAKARQAYR